MKFRITFALLSLVFMSLYAQKSVSANQLEDLLNGGYTNVESMAYHEAKKNAVPTTKPAATKPAAPKKEKVSAQQLEDLLNGGYTNVESMNYHQGNTSGNMQVRNHAATTTTPAKPTSTTTVGQITLGDCTAKEEGKTVIYNGGQKIYQCLKSDWIRIK